MTKEQLNRGKEIREEILKIQEAIDEQDIALLKTSIPFGRKQERVACSEDKSYFECETCEYIRFIESLIKNRKERIEQLEKEFKEL